MWQARRAGVVALLACGWIALGTAACGGGSPAPTYRQRDPGPEIAPVLVVERFLRAANANKILVMARLFGTAEGSILERGSEAVVEQRMFVIASVLRHEDYALAGERIVPGRLGEAKRLLVRLDKGAREVVVPFTVVRSHEGGWLIEKIGIERITSGRGL